MRLFNFAVEKGCINSNPIARLKQRHPCREKGESLSDDIVHFLSPEQISLLYKLVANDLRMNAIVHLLHRTGARIFELLALNLEDIDAPLPQRADRGEPRVVPKATLERYCEVIAALKVRTSNGKKRHLSTGEAIRLLEERGIQTPDGLVPELLYLL